MALLAVDKHSAGDSWDLKRFPLYAQHQPQCISCEYTNNNKNNENNEEEEEEESTIILTTTKTILIINLISNKPFRPEVSI